MNPSHATGSLRRALTACLVGAAFLLVPLGSLAAPLPPSPAKVIDHAWENAHEAGTYRFATEIVQTTYPALAVTNVGRSPRQETFYLEGETNLPARTMHLTLWKGEGSVLSPGSGVEVRLEGDRAYGRQVGGPWQEMDDFSEAFAPADDHLAYLVAAKNVRELATETRSLQSLVQDGQEWEVTFTRYAFDVDGPRFARYIRDRLEQQLAERGELPFGMTLDVPRQYLDMTGSGEVWIDSHGLPLRLTVHLDYPEQTDGSQVKADLQTDFHGFPQSTGTASTVPAHPLARAAAALGRAVDGRACQRTALSGAVAAGFLGLLFLGMRRRHSRRVYATLVALVILSMLIVPLLHAQQVYAFTERFNERQAEQEARAREYEATRAFQEQLTTPDWDPNQDPLPEQGIADPEAYDPSSADLTALGFSPPAGQSAIHNDQEEAIDQDQDGLTEAQENALGTSDTDIDWDNDGLTDGQELLRLGTDALQSDSDGDGLSDYVEVTGFVDGHSRQWYTDPNNMDTNSDGRLDTVECYERVTICEDRDEPNDGIQADECPALQAVCSDTDGDEAPDIFDTDDDGDGVSDRVDLSPNSIVDRNGQRHEASSPAPFDRDNPFSLQVEHLTTGLPVFVDVQLRPVISAHLTYAMNVLDWPGGDMEGQIQRVRDTTFADSLTTEEIEADPRSQNGDMRLIPMLEIEMSDDNGVPLPLTQPAIDVEIQGGISGTIELEQQGSSIALTPHLEPAGTYELTIYEGSCRSPGAKLKTLSGVANGAVTTTSDPYSFVVDLANGQHAISVADGSGTEVCGDVGNIINGPYDNWMIDPEPLAPYGIVVREKDRASTLLAYAPLNLVSDETGGNQVAFTARMLYWTGGQSTWESEQALRVVWSVQMLTDWCDQDRFSPSDDAKYDTVKYQEELESFCAKPANRTADAAQIVHVYDEEWFLTGLAVREDHGLDIAISYENPATDDDLEFDDSLWLLARGLGAAFVTGRDCDNVDSNDRCLGGNGIRDIGVVKERMYKVGATEVMTTVADSTIAERFGSSVSSSVTITDRWDIPFTAPLEVENLSYPHQDYVTHVAMTETVRILDPFPTDIIPTLLFAREEHYRRIGLDMEDDSLVRWDGDRLVVDADPDKLRLDTIVSLNWASYRYNSDVGPDGEVVGWETYPVREHWDQLEIKFQALFERIFPDESEEFNAGWTVLARSYYISLLNGLANQVQSGWDLIWEPDPDTDNSDAELRMQAYSLGTGYGSKILSVVLSVGVAAYKYYGWKEIVFNKHIFKANWEQGFIDEWVIQDLRYEHHDFLESLGKSLKDYFVSDWITVWKGGVKGKVGVGIGLVGVVAAIGITAYAISQCQGIEIVAQVLIGLNLVMQIQGMVGTVAKVMNAVKEAGSMSAAVSQGLSKTGQSIGKAFKSVAIVGLIIGVVVTWGAFALQVALSDMTTTELITAIVGAVVSTAVMILMFIISQIPIVGWIITAVIGLIDAVVALICSVFLTDEQKASTAGQWLCGGLTGIVTKALTHFFFSSKIMVIMQPEGWDRLELTNFDQTIRYPHNGIYVGSELVYSVAITNNLYLEDPYHEWGMEKNYTAAWDADTVKSSTFDYKWQTSEVDFHEGLDREEMVGEWQPVCPGCSGQYLVDTIRSDAQRLSATGINQPQDLYLSEAYAVPKMTCVTVVCDVGTERGTEHYNLGQGLKLDVLPATLDGFYARVAKEDGYSLAWGQEGDLTFPTQDDFDGDGLLKGVDPDDRWWDTDSDGLSDDFELKIGSDPENKDTDGDGLIDHEELRVGTHPSRPDSDSDGLKDGEEVFHQDVLDEDGDGDKTEWLGGWLYAYDLAEAGGLLETWVWPDALDPDIDGDVLSDFQERTFGFHPRWPSDPSVLSFESIVREKTDGTYETSDGFVKPGDTLYYEAKLKNQLYNRWAQGLLTTDFPQDVVSSELLPEPFILYPQEEEVLQGDVPLSGTGSSGTYGLTQVAGALVADWAELAGGAKLWYQFEEPITATLFIDRSGNQPVHDGTCSDASPGSGCVPTKDDGVYGGALRLDGTAYVTSQYDVSKGDYAVSFWFKTQKANGGLFSVDAPPTPTPGFQVYLQGGNVCGSVPYHPPGTASIFHETICTGGGGYDDGQWHHVVHTYGDTEGQSLYVNGGRLGSGVQSALSIPDEVGIQIGRSLDPDSLWLDWSNFTGLMDDVRVYGEVLRDGEVAALFNQPVFHMKFDGNGWRDASAWGANGSCNHPDCPEREPGVAGKSAQFDGTDYLSVGPSPNLDLSGGRFTIAGWIYPRVYAKVERFVLGPTGRSGNWVTEDDRRTNHPQGILGQRTGQDNAYPTLERVGRKIQFGFGAQGSGWPQVPYLSDDVLTENAWNHVVLTFDEGTLKLYVNGIEVDQDSGTFQGLRPTARTSFSIGRVNNQAVLTLDRMEPQTPSQFSDPAKTREDKSEYCWSFAGQQILRKEDIGWGPSADFDIGLDTDVTEAGTLKFWEDDAGGQECGAGPDGKDEDLILENVREPDYGDTDGWDGLTFSTDYASADGLHYWYDDDGQGDWPEGSLFFTFDNPSVPFYGKIDEIVIYNRPLRGADVEALYRATSELMHLPLDEPPGETSFQTTGITREKGVCSGAACPTSGLIGRVGQTTLFDGDDHITFPHGAANELTKDFTISGWIKPEDLEGDHQILSTARTASNDGFAFGTYGDWLNVNLFGRGECRYPVTDLEAGRWVHVAVSFQYDTGPTFYINGARDTQIECNYAFPNADLDDRLLIGATTNAGSAVPVQHFKGFIDDLRIYRPALSDAQIRALYQAAPLLQMPLDEDPGASSFVNVANYQHSGSCTGASCPKTGTKGQLGLAAEFDGVDDLITVPDRNELDLNRFSVGAWVLPTAVRSKHQPILAKDNASAGHRNYGLLIKENSMRVRFGFQEDDCTTWRVYDSQASLLQNQWNHVMMTYDGQYLALYVNGQRDSRHALSTALCQSSSPLKIGNEQSSSFAPFVGRIDQVTVYGQALSRPEVEELFRYQGQWVEERQSQTIVVDGEKPTSWMQLDDDYLPQRAVQMLVEAHDDTSGVGTVRLLVNGTAQDAEPCLGAAGDSLWCTWFEPASGGRYTLQTQAIDVAGNEQATPLPEYVVLVDGQAPVADSSLANGSLLFAQRHATLDQVWTVHLEGSIVDPGLPGGHPGSGVDPQVVEVILRAGDGTRAGPAPQWATVAGDVWTIDYLLTKAQIDGSYMVQVQATDRTGNQATTEVVTIQIDTSAPAAYLDRASIPGDAISDTITLSGAVTEQPVPLRVEWTTEEGSGDQVSLSIECDGITLYAAEPGHFLGGAMTYGWNTPVHRGAACQVTIAQGQASGLVEVCGSQVADWAAGSGGTTFTADAAACDPMVGVAGVAGVEIAFSPQLPGSPFHNEVLLEAEILRLPFEDTPIGMASVRFQDISGHGHHGACDGSICPATGQIGLDGNAVRFDGTADHIVIGDDPDFDLGTGPLSLALWFKSTPSGRGDLFSWRNEHGDEFSIRLTQDGTIQVYLKVDGAGGLIVSDGGTFDRQRWHHLAVVRNGGVWKTYLDGVEAGSGSDGADLDGIDAGTPLWLGANRDDSGNPRFGFEGWLDEVILAGRALSPQEIQDLYLGSGPVLDLSFEDPWLIDGDTVYDGSGREHRGTLSSGAGDVANKAGIGKVGAHALQVDGVNDLVTIPDSPAMDLSAFSIGTWVKPQGATLGHPIDKGHNYWLHLVADMYIQYGFRAGDCSTSHINWSSVRLIPDQWTHLLMTYDGSQLSFYLNGELDRSEPLASTVCHNDEPVRLGEGFAGRLDGTRIYPRALSPQEVKALYHSAWQTAETTPNGAGVILGAWSAPVPAGLEGAYRLDLRGQDVGGAVDFSADTENAWQGEVDTLTPRLSLTREDLGSALRFSTTAQDFYLTEDGFNSPCGAGVITGREYFQAPWYLALTGESPERQQRLYQLEAICEVPYAQMQGEVGALDTPGLAHGVAVAHNYAYVADSSGGLHVVGVSDPTLPQLLGTSTTAMNAHDVVVAPGGAIGQPDLVVGNLAIEPASPTIKQPVTVTVVVTNQGIAPAWDFNTAVYLDLAPTPCDAGVGSVQSAHTHYLAAGASVTLTLVYGGFTDIDPHALYAQTDTACVVEEADETNNVTGPLALTPVAAELVLVGVEISPASPEVNQPFTISVTLSNTGTAAAQNFLTSVYTDAYASLCDAGAGGWQSRETAFLAPGASRTISFTHPGLSTVGSHFVEAQVDSSCVVNELEESSNNLPGHLSFDVVGAAQPDLVVTLLAADPALPLVGQPFVVTVTVENQGTAAAGAFNTTVYTNHVPASCGDTTGAWGTESTTSLAASASRTMTFTHPGLSATGWYTIHAFADRDCEVAESDEGNNVSYALQVLVTSESKPDLTILDLATVPTSPEVGEPVDIVVDIKNQGTADATMVWTCVYSNVTPSPCDEGAPFWLCTDPPITVTAGALAVVTYSLTSGFSATGEYTVSAQVDAGCSVAEALEDNNIFGPITVTVQPPIPLALAVEDPVGSDGTNNVGETLTPETSTFTLAMKTLNSPLRTPLASTSPYTYAYVADNSFGLRILDVSDPSAPTQVGSAALAGYPEAVALSGIYAYVASQYAGLQIIDITSPAVPGLLSTYGTADRARGVAVLGTLAYVADDQSGLHIVDVSDAENPDPRGVLSLPGFARDVAVAGGPGGLYAYVACGAAGLQVVDVTDPYDPKVAGSYNTPSYAYGLSLSGSTALVADGAGGLVVLDISDPTQPQHLRTLDTEAYAWALQVADNLAFVAGYSEGLRIINYEGVTPRATACDAYGHCTTVDAAPAGIQAAMAGAPALAEDLTVSISGVPDLLASTDPISVTGEAAANLTYLKALTVTVDASPILSELWPDGTMTETFWSTTWTPAGDGQYLLQADLSDYSMNTASATQTVTVDTTPPQITVEPTTYTSTHYYEPRTIDLTGLVTDTGGVAGVEVTADGDTGEAYLIGGDHAWRFPWNLGTRNLPDSQTYTVTAQAIDIVGHTTRVTETVTFDVVPPSGITLSLSSDGHELVPFATVTQTAPTLTLTWTAGDDGSTVAGYQAGWTVQTTETVSTTLAHYGPADERRATYAANEAQKIWAQVGSHDGLGNEGWQSLGPVYVDGPQTPDYILLDDPDGTYYGWMESGCTRVGIDRRVARFAPGGASLDTEQHLYVSWNARALRLAWTGANWNDDGDLFVYLDTEVGGSATAYNPYTATPANEVLLPAGMQADYLVWIQDATTALLLHWTGTEWQDEGSLALDQFRFQAGLNDGHTDLYLPFELLDISSPAATSLDLVALASEDPSTGAGEALKLWALMPSTNPVNSERVLAGGAAAGGDLALSHSYHWDALGDGLCPNGSDGSTAMAYLDIDLRVSLQAEPAGVVHNLPQSGIFDPASLLGAPDTAHPPVGPGQEISYTVRYHNRGQDQATDVTLDVTALYALSLPDGDTAQHQAVLLGNLGVVEPGERGEVTFRGIVSTSLSSEPWAAVDARLYDSTHTLLDPPLAHPWVHHQVDNQPPAFFGIQRPAYLVAAGPNPLLGYAYDESGVPLVRLQVEAPGGGITSLACPDGSPGDGQWTCTWDVAGSNNDVLSVTLQAEDAFGTTSGWSNAHPFMVDTEPPQVTVDISTTEALSGSLIQGGLFGLHGQVTDNGGVATVDTCVDGTCSAADLQLEATQAPVIYEDVAAIPLAIGASTACPGTMIERVFNVSEDFVVGGVRLGFVAGHSRRDDIWAELVSPGGTHVLVLDDDGLASTHYQNYDLLLDDAAPTAVALALGDHDPGPPFYQRFARPQEPFQAFLGQPSGGLWTLHICDLDGGAHDGAYYRSRLTLTPLDTAPKAGAWSSQLSIGQDTDYAVKTVTIYGQDLVGNRTPDPLSIVMWLDNVPPALTVTEVISEVQFEHTETVLRGTVSDGDPLVEVNAYIHTPDGEAYRQPAQRSGDDWSVDLAGNAFGTYTIWMRASDRAGNSALSGPFEIEVPCVATDLLVLSIAGEPMVDPPGSVLLSAVISNTGEVLPAGLPVSFYLDDTRLGTTTTTQVLGSGVSETVTLLWNADSPGTYEVSVVLDEEEASLCSPPSPARQKLSIRDIPLTEEWNLVSTYVDPFNDDIQVVQRPIQGQYVVIQGFDQGVLSSYPGGGLNANPLQTMDGEHGYWIKVTGGVSPTLRIVGQILPEYHPLPLYTGWNLVSYLLQQPHPVAEALQNIEGQYTAVLGFEDGALSYYPDLEPSFNTLHEMKPLAGYWVRTTGPVTLQYRKTPAGLQYRYWLPIVTKAADAGAFSSASVMTNMVAPVSDEEPAVEALAEMTASQRSGQASTVIPTSTWVNFYGPALALDGTPLPVGSRVLAVDPDDVVCGSVEVTIQGQYGLLPCYGDDPTTPDVDEGAEPGDPIKLMIEDIPASQQPLEFNGEASPNRAPILWTAHGDRWEVAIGPSPVKLPYALYLPQVSKDAQEAIYAASFEDGAGPEWSKPSTDTAPKGQTFLGQFGAETVSLTLTDLPAHTEATITFDLYIIRSWDGNEATIPAGTQSIVAPEWAGPIGPDVWELAISGGETLLHTTFSNWDEFGFRQAYPDNYPGGDHPARTGAASENALGFEYDGPHDTIYQLTFTFEHTGDELILDFSATGLQPLEDESWGLDNIRVTCY